jgi:hypothetical protein
MALAAIIISALALLVSILATYTAHRNRPLRIKSIEQHTLELKDTIRQWLTELYSRLPPEPCESIWVPSSEKPIIRVPWPREYSLPIESKALFKDLNNHLNEEMDDWQGYKSLCNDYISKKYAFTTEVLNIAKNVSGLEVYTKEPNHKQDLLLWKIVVCLMQDIGCIAEGKSPNWFESNHKSLPIEPSSKGGFFKMYMDGEVLLCCFGQDKCRLVFDKLQQWVDYIILESKSGRPSPILEHYKEVSNLFSAICGFRDKLRTDLEEKLAFPTIHNPKCKYIKQSPT